MSGNQKAADQKFSKTIQYYDENAEAFVEQTQGADLSELHRAFLSKLPHPARILDAGSGSGRDSLAFKQFGHDVVAIDASAEMIKYTREIADVPTVHATFLEFQSDTLFDGIWTCASLLHVEKSELPQTLKHFSRLLVDGGAIFVSFKVGSTEQIRNGRFFRDMNVELLTEVLSELPELALDQAWNTRDARPGRNEEWLNGILVKEGE